MLVIISSMSMSIGNCFYVRQANMGKISTFKRATLKAAHSKNFMIVACTVLIQYSSVTNRQRGGRTDGQTDAFARKNGNATYKV